MIRFYADYKGKQIIFTKDYTYNNYTIKEGTRAVIIEVISSYEVVLSIEGINEPMKLYNSDYEVFRIAKE